MWEIVLADEDRNRFVAAVVCLFDTHRGYGVDMAGVVDFETVDVMDQGLVAEGDAVMGL